MMRILSTVSVLAAPSMVAFGLEDQYWCAEAGTFKTASSHHAMEGGNMICKYPSDSTGLKFPLLSFEHGDTQGGILLEVGYEPLLRTIASSGFVVCAPLMCTIPCRAQQSVHQLNAITAAKELGKTGNLPIRSEGGVGVFGHSTGGMTTIKIANKHDVAKYGIGAAMGYNPDGPAKNLIEKDNVNFGDIEPSLPMFLVTGTRDIIEPRGSTQDDTDAILKANPAQPLLVAELNGEGHLDNINIPILHPAPLKAVPYIIAFFGHTLMQSSAQCTAKYKDLMGDQLKKYSPQYYKNQLFGSAAPLVDAPLVDALLVDAPLVGLQDTVHV